MSLIYKQRKNYTEVTSSYFEDVKMLKKSMSEVKADKFTNKIEYPGFDFGKLELANAVQIIMLAKYGARELSAFVDSLSPYQYDKYKINYGPWKDYEEELAKESEEQSSDIS